MQGIVAYISNKEYVLLFSFVVYFCMLIYMGVDTNIWKDSFFFKVTVNGDDPSLNPHVLGVPITTVSQFCVFCLFFFFNAFLGVWNNTLIDRRYGLLLNDPVVQEQVKKKYPFVLFFVYSIWTAMRNFFNILGVFSNGIFFLFTVFGFIAGITLSRLYVLHPDKINEYKKELNAGTQFNYDQRVNLVFKRLVPKRSDI